MKVTLTPDNDRDESLLDGKESVTYTIRDGELGIFALVLMQKDLPTVTLTHTSNAVVLLGELAKMTEMLRCQAIPVLVAPRIAQGLEEAFGQMQQKAALARTLANPNLKIQR